MGRVSKNFKKRSWKYFQLKNEALNGRPAVTYILNYERQCQLIPTECLKLLDVGLVGYVDDIGYYDTKHNAIKALSIHALLSPRQHYTELYNLPMWVESLMPSSSTLTSVTVYTSANKNNHELFGFIQRRRNNKYVFSVPRDIHDLTISWQIFNLN